MKELLVEYSISEIIIFVVILAFAVKELVTFVDWGKDRLRKTYDEETKSIEQHKELKDEIKDLNGLYKEKERIDDTFAEINSAISKINGQIDMLVESDKESIKAYITEKHHFFVYSQGWVDDYSLECLERRFAVYRQEHGNSFVCTLMDEIRELPKQAPEADAKTANLSN